MHRDESRLGLALTVVFAAFALGTAGCEQSYACTETSDLSGAELTGTISHVTPTTSGDVREDETFTGDGDGATTIGDEMENPNDGTCVSFGTYGKSAKGHEVDATIQFDCVAGAGSYRLEDLHATACASLSYSNFAGDYYQNCGPISGTITVRTFARSCRATTGCAKIDAELVVVPVAGSAVSINAHAQLLVDETVDQCQQPLVTFPGGD